MWGLCQWTTWGKRWETHFFCRGFKLLIWLKIDSRNLLLAWWPSRCHWRYSPSPPRLTAQCQGEAPSCNPALHLESPSSPWWSSGTVWCSPPAPYLVSNRHCNSWTQTQRVSIIKRSLWLPLRLYSSACIFVFLRWKLQSEAQTWFVVCNRWMQWCLVCSLTEITNIYRPCWGTLPKMMTHSDSHMFIFPS